MMDAIAKAYVQIVPTTKGIKQDLEDQIGGEGLGASIGSKIGSGLKKGIKVAAAGIGAGIFASLKLGADLEQQLGGAEAVFEKFHKELVATSKTAFIDMGLSQNEFLQGANKMGSLFQGAGHSVKDSLEMSTGYMQRASDVASIMGIDTSEALEAVTGAAKGNFTMMDNLGVAMNATTLEAYALEKGMNVSWKEMSNAEKTGLAYQMFMEKTAKYAGNYAKENDTLAGSLNTLKTGFATLLAQLGQGEDVTATLDGLKDTAKSFMTSLTDSLKNIGEQAPTIINELAPAFNELANTFIPILIPIFSEMFGAIFGAVASNLPALLSAIIAQIPSIGMALFDAFMNADVGGKIGLAILAGFTAFSLGTKLMPIIGTALGFLKNIKIPAIPAGGGAGFGAFMQSLANGLKAFGNPAILKGAAILAAAMVILSAATWASIKIIADSLPTLGTALASFNDIDGVNLLAVGAGLMALGLGLAALTAGSIIDGLAKLMGGGFENALRSIIEPIAALMPTITEADIMKFSQLGTGLLALAAGYIAIKGFTNGSKIADSIESINKAVVNAAPNIANYSTVSTGLKTLSTGLKALTTLSLSDANVSTYLTSITSKLSTLNNFNWGSAQSTIRGNATKLGSSIGQGIAAGVGRFNWSALATSVRIRGNNIGLAICQGVTQGINNNAFGFINALAIKIDEMISNAKKRADINSPSGEAEREIGQWLLPGVQRGVDRSSLEMPDVVSQMKASSNQLELGSSNVNFPTEFTIVDDDGFMVKIKAVAKEEILRNNINMQLVK